MLLSEATTGRSQHPENRRPPAVAVSVQVFSLSASLFVKSRFARLALGRFTRAHGLPLCAVESFSVAHLAGFTFFMRLDHASARRSRRGSSRRAPCSAPTSPGPWSGAAASLPGATSDAIRGTLGPRSSAAIPRAIPSTNCRDTRPRASNHGSSLLAPRLGFAEHKIIELTFPARADAEHSSRRTAASGSRHPPDKHVQRHRRPKFQAGECHDELQWQRHSSDDAPASGFPGDLLRFGA
jgi:hypothetical protein